MSEHHQTHQEEQDEFSLKNYFIPLTTVKAIHIIAIIGFIVFANMLFNNFVWDDKTYIIYNPEIHQFNFTKLIQSNMFNTAANYRPISALYFASIFSFFKDSSFFYHFIQLILHIVNAALLFILFKKFINKNIALFLSIIFLVHPIQVESVSFIASTGNLLFFLFGISALLLSFSKIIGTKRLVIISLLLLLSILSKETGFLFLFMTIFFMILYKRRKVYSSLFLGLFIAIIYFFIRFGIGGVYLASLEIIPINKLPVLERLTNVPAIIFYYLKTLFFPIHLSINQLWIVSELNFQFFYFPLVIIFLLVIVFLVLGIYCYKKNIYKFKIYLFFLIWFLSGIAMHMQILPLNLTVADRWFYFPLAGILGVVGITLQSSNFLRKFKMVGTILAILIIIFLSLRTIVRNIDWKDAISLYSHDMKMHTNYDLENNLGAEYASIKDYDKALEHYMKSTQLYPFAANTYNVGYIYEQKGDYLKAKEYYSKALKESEQFDLKNEQVLIIYERLTYISLLTDDPKITINFINERLKDYPNSVNLWMYLAIAEYKADNQAEALQAAEKAKNLYPNEKIESLYNKILNKEKINFKP